MTLLVGLDNPGSKDPRFALAPFAQNGPGARMVSLIAAIIPGYAAEDYLADFDRVCLYPTGHAKNGKGKIAMDRAMADWCFLLAHATFESSIVLLGLRVRAAFEHIVPLPDKDVSVVRFDGMSIHAIPHPSAMSSFYNDLIMRDRIGIRLASLRNNKNEGLPARQAN